MMAAIWLLAAASPPLSMAVEGEATAEANEAIEAKPEHAPVSSPDPVTKPVQDPEPAPAPDPTPEPEPTPKPAPEPDEPSDPEPDHTTAGSVSRPDPVPDTNPDAGIGNEPAPDDSDAAPDGEDVETSEENGEEEEAGEEEEEDGEEGEEPDGGEEPPELPETPEPLPVLRADTRGRIILDGCLDDWEEVSGMTHNLDASIAEWKMARDLSGNLYLCYTGTAVGTFDTSYLRKEIKIVQLEGTVDFWLDSVKYTSYQDVQLQDTNMASDSAAGPYCVEVMIPADYLDASGFTIFFAGKEMSSASLPVLDGVDLPPKEPAKYRGIAIDGNFSDWDAVAKAPFQDTNKTHDNLESAAFLFDGSNVYIYIKETVDGDAETAGDKSTGNYAITTDLGRVLKFQLKKEGGGTVYGVAGAEARHVGTQWEIKIPASSLPYYRDSLSFGLYLEEPVISDVSNLNGGGGNVGGFSGIKIDGYYDDWASYPHATIEYATAGTHAKPVDTQGALYFEGTTLYGHVMTTMPEHLDSLGGDFLASITIALKDRNYYEYLENGNFYPCMLMPDGSLETVNEYYGTTVQLDPGTYTFLICDGRDLSGGRQVFGEMRLTIDKDRVCDEMEFKLDLAAVAERQGVDVSDYKVIEAQFGRLGQQWITTAGASSGAYLGVVLCCGAAAGVWFWRRKKGAAR